MAVQKIKTLADIISIRVRFRESGRKLVFTNGCFDLLHLGHVRFLAEARSSGDALVVGLNSDRSVRLNKGPGRPIVPAAERAEIIAALASVDYVFMFEDPTPQRVIDAIVPDILVKGSDWGISEIVGRETVERSGGKVVSVPTVEGFSTSAIIASVVERFASQGHGRPAEPA